jgi:hypothetical protein
VEEILIGSTDRSILVYIADPASTDGSGKTGLAHSDMTVSNTRVETDNDVVNTDYTSSLNALTNLTDAHNDWGWKEVSATLAPGLYRLDVADALFATGAWYSVLSVAITTGLASVTPKVFKLVNLDMFGTPATNLATAGTNYSATRGLSGTALPAAAADAAGGLPISDAGGLDLDAKIGALTFTVANVLDANTLRVGGTVQTAGDLKTLIDAVDNFVDTEIADIQARLPAALTADGNMKADALRFGGTLYATALAAEVDAVWDEDATGHQTQGTFGQAIGDPAADSDSIWALVNTNLDATVSSRASQTSVDTIDDFLDTEVAAILAAVDTEVATIVTQTTAASIRTAVGLASANLDTQLADLPTVAEFEARTIAAANYATASALDAVDNYVDTEIGAIQTTLAALFTTALTESYNTDGAAPTVAQALCGIYQTLTEGAISGTGWTVKKLDGSTTAFGITLDSATTPTTKTRSS